jgi:WD40 repeat protein
MSTSNLHLLLAYAEDPRPVLDGGLPLASVLSEPPPRPLPGPGQLYDIGGDPNQLSAQRWDVIAPEGSRGRELVERVKPLIKRRAEQQGAKVRIYQVPPGMDAVAAEEWRKRVLRASSVPKREQPRYLLVLGHPHEVSFELQQQLGVDSYVGRLAFERPEDYRAYVEKVLRWEGLPSRERARTLFFTAHDRSPALEQAYQWLVQPNLGLARSEQQRGTLPVQQVVELCGGREDYAPEDAARRLLEGTREVAASVLFTVSHGMGSPRAGEPWRDALEQRLNQGALGLGRDGQRRRHSLRADMVGKGAFLPGGIWFLFACFGVGTPTRSTYLPWLERLKARFPQQERAIADILASAPVDGRGFVSALPMTALANPEGPLAVIGHLDLAWTYAFMEPTGLSRSPRFFDVLGQLVQARRAGVALDVLTRATSEVSVELTQRYQRDYEAARTGGRAPEDPLGRALLWMSRHDLAGYVLLGDPAVQLPASPQAPVSVQPSPVAPPSVSASIDVRPAIEVRGVQHFSGEVPAPRPLIRDEEPAPQPLVRDREPAPRPLVPGSRAGAAPSSVVPVRKMDVLALELIRAERADQPFELPTGPLTYLRNEDGRVRQSSLPWSKEMLADLSALMAPVPDRSAVQRLGNALRQFVNPLDWSQDEIALQRALADERGVSLSLRFAAAELYSLPWELLTLEGSGQHLGERGGVDIRYCWPAVQPALPSEPPEAGGRLLFAWSNAGGNVPVNEHLEAIRDACVRGNHRFDPERDVLGNVSLAGLARALAESREPVVALHLLCHGSRRGNTLGLMLSPSRPGSAPELVDAGSLRQTLEPYAKQLRLVVLSACRGGDSEELGSHLGGVAQALHRVGLAAVVASRLPLSVDGSVLLTRTLYSGLLVELSSLQRALAVAREQLRQGRVELDWASLQLYAFDHEGSEYHPFVFRPYRGLLAFEPSHCRFFFGRTALREELTQRILEAGEGKRPRFQVVAGASGSGKSSLLMAGVAPWLPSGTWDYRVMRPGDSAVLSEVERLSTERPESKLLLIVDQFEEVFTQLPPKAREPQVQRLWKLARREGSNVVIVATLRVDFLDHCVEVGLGEGLRLDSVVYDEAHRLFVPQLGPTEYPEIITGPAHRVGLQLEEGLVERIVADLGEEPGALPLLEYALDLLWQQREGGRLTREAYERITRTSGIAGALTATMDALHERLSPEEQAQARRLLVSLVDFRDDSSPYTRRRVELEAVRPSEEGARRTFDTVLERLVQSRFVVRGSEQSRPERAGAVTLEVAHEALIRRWARLGQWLQEDQEKELQLRQLQGWASEWTKRPKDTGYLLSGSRLGYAQSLQERYKSELPGETLRFIEESRKLDERRRRNVRIRVLATIGFTLAAAIVMGGLWRDAEDRRKQAHHLAITASAQFISQSDPTLAVSLLKEIPPPHEDAWTQTAIDTLQQPVAAVVLRGHEKDVVAVTFNKDGTRVLTGSADGTARIWGTDGRGSPIVLEGHTGPVVSAAFSSDGSRVLTGSMDKTLRVWSVGQPDASLALDHSKQGGLPDGIIARFSPDGTQVISITSDGRVWLWPLEGQPSSPVEWGGGRSREFAFVTLDAEATRVCAMTKTGTAEVWPLNGSGEPLVNELKVRGGRVRLKGGLFSPDCNQFFASATDGTAHLWRMDAPGEPLPLTWPFSNDAIATVEFSPKGTFLLSRSKEGLGYIWRTGGKGVPLDLKGRPPIGMAAFSPDERRVLTGNSDGTASLWSTEEHGEPRVLKGECGVINAVAFSQDGIRAAIACSDGAVRLWKLERQSRFSLHEDFEGGDVEFSPDGKHVLSISQGGTRIWSLDAQGALSLVHDFGYLHSPLFSSDGSRLLFRTRGGQVSIWHRDGGDEPLVIKDGTALEDAAFDPQDGSRVALSYSDGSVRIWSADREGELLASFKPHSQKVSDISYSPDGARILTASEDGTAKVWRVDGQGKPLVLPHPTAVGRAVFNSKGTAVLTAAIPEGEAFRWSEIRDFRVWYTDRPGAPRSIGQFERANFSSDGTRILAVEQGHVSVWRTDTEDAPLRLVIPMENIFSVSYIPEGERVVTVSEAGVRLWRLGYSSAPVFLRGDFRAAAVSRDKRRILTVAKDGTSRLWSVDGEWLTQQISQATTDCLRPLRRELHLAETEQEAQRACEVCEHEYDRPPENCEPKRQ